MKHNVRFLMGMLFTLSLTQVVAQPTVRLDATKTHQHITVLIEGHGEVVLSGQGETGYAVSPLTATFRGTYTPAPLYSGDYVLAQQDGQWGFSRVDTPAVLSPFDVYATLPGQASFLPLAVQVGIVSVTSSSPRSAAVYDIQGRRVNDASLAPGLYIKNGKKMMKK